MKKRIISLFTSLLMVFSLVMVMPSMEVSATGYNASNAISYAQKYWQNYNSNYSNYNSIGGDCANFVSQCLYAGGLNMDSNWYWYSYSNRSSSWSYCPSMIKYFRDQGYTVIDYASASDIKEGNPVFYWNGNTGNWAHVAICTGHSGNTPLVSAHNKDHWNVEWTLGGANWWGGSTRRATVLLNGGREKILPGTIDNSYAVPTNVTATHKISTYDEYGNVESNRYISPDDNCYISEVYTNGFVKVRYPTPSGDRWSYAKRDDFDIPLKTPQGKEMTTGAGRTIPDGEYIITSGLGQNLYLDIPGVDYPAKSGGDITICDGSVDLPDKSEKFDTWTVRYLNNGFYRISQNGTDICLDVKNASLDRGTYVQTCTDNGCSAQQWSITLTQYGYKLQARCNGYCLDVENSKTATGTKVLMWEDTGNKNQSWGFIPVALDDRPIADGEYYIKSACGNVWLDADGDFNYKNETNIQVWNSKNDKFNVKYVGDGYYKICEVTSGLALDVYNPGDNYLGMSVNVQLYDGSNINNRAQLWRIKDEGNGYYSLISKLSGYTLDLNGQETANGSNVQQFPYNYTIAQKWSFEIIKCATHSYGNWQIKKTATENEDGLKGRTCSICGETQTQKIDRISGAKYLYGDANGDGLVNDDDVSAIRNYIAGVQPQIVVMNSDLNNDGIINSKDLVRIRIIMLQLERCSNNEHDFPDWTITKAATCTADGNQTRKCSVCGKTETKTIAKTGHTVVIDKAAAATCTASGKTEGSHCSKCGTVIKAQTTIPAKGHTFGSWTTTKAATCTADGNQTRKCSVCGKTETKTIAKTGHTVVIDKAAAATCTASGKTEGSHCSKCGTAIKAQTTIPAKGHTFGSWTTTKAATCTADGNQTRKCSVCGKTETKTIAKTGHKYTTKVVAPTATSQGYTLHTCSVCGDSYKDNYTDCVKTEKPLITGLIDVSGIETTEHIDFEIRKTDSEEVVFVGEFVEGAYSIPILSAGKYTVTASQENCAPRTYNITVGEKPIELDVELHLYGDVNADGKVTVSDVAKVNSHIKKKAELTDYDFAVADVNTDGKLSVSDSAKINAHMKGKSLLW